MDKELTNFQSFEPLVQYQVKFSNDNPSKALDFSNKMRSEAGFKFTAFENGRASNMLQGLNDAGTGRNYISYHSLNYSRWNPFFEEYRKIIDSISKLDSGLFVTAISLHYIDLFFWTSSGNVELDLLFNKNSTYIPSEFFNAIVNNYSIVTEKQKDAARKYLDRLEITVDNNLQHSVTVSHNVTQPLPEVFSLQNLLTGGELSNILNAAHLHNKKILADLLTSSASQMINLKL